MASYLKFDGQEDTARGLCQWTAGLDGDTVVFTCFARILSWPDSPAPIMALEGGSLSTGIFVGHSGGQGSDKVLIGRFCCDVLGTPVAFTVQGTTVLRLGRIYKFVLAVGYSSPNTTAKLYLDGLEIATLSSGFPIEDYSGSTSIAFGGLLSHVIGTPNRSVHMEVFQGMLEIDRDYSGIFTQSDSDPFTDLELDASADAAKSSRWLMNEGSGTTVFDEEGNADLSIVTNPPDWAPAADPTFTSKGVARFDFESVWGWNLRAADSPLVLPQPIHGPNGPVGDKTSGELRLAPRGGWHWSDANTIVGYYLNVLDLALSTNQIFTGKKSIRADGSTNYNTYSSPPAWSGPFTSGKWWARILFYDPGGTSSSRLQRLGFGTSTGTPRIDVGMRGGESTTHYVTSVIGATTVSEVSSVPISVGWHEFLIYVEASSAGTDTIRFYIDGTLVRTETSATFTESSLATFIWRRNGVSGSSDDGYLGMVELGRDGGGGSSAWTKLYESSGSVVLPLLQPLEGVKFFRSVVITEEYAGNSSREIGQAPTYSFRHSIDGGTTWGSSKSLTNVNLQALACAGDGKDVIEITVGMASGLDDMASPACRSIVLYYEPALEIIRADIPHVEEEILVMEEAA